jgi:hypothetical protein
MTEQQAKHIRKLNQAVKDAVKAIPEQYSLEDLESDLKLLRKLEHKPGERKLSTQMITGLLRWQIDNL